MSYDMNHFACSGRLGADPKLRYTQAGKAVANLNVAINVTKDETLWFRAVAWEKTAEMISERCKKGSRVILQGSLRQNQWTDQDGNKRQTVELTVREWFSFDKPTQSESNKPDRVQGWGSDSKVDDEIPF